MRQSRRLSESGLTDPPVGGGGGERERSNELVERSNFAGAILLVGMISVPIGVCGMGAVAAIPLKGSRGELIAFPRGLGGLVVLDFCT